MRELLLILVVVSFCVTMVGCSNEVDEAEKIMEEQIPILMGDAAEKKMFAWCKDNDNKERVQRITNWLHSPEGKSKEAQEQLEELERSGLFEKYRQALRKPTPSSVEARRMLRECVINYSTYTE